MNIESELSHLLRRTDPPEGFAERVLKRLNRRAELGPHKKLRALAAAAMIAVVFGGWGIYAVLRARDEVLTAIRIASQKVAHAQREVRGVSH